MSSTNKLTKFLFEGILIVLSILIAFAIDAWWEERKEDIEAEKLLVNLQQDFLRNKELLHYTVNRYNSAEDHIRGLLVFIRPGDPDRDTNVPDSLVLSLFTDWVSYDPALGTLNSAISSGKIGLIKNEALRTELAVWEDLVQDLKEGERTDFSHKTLIQDEIFDYVALRSIGKRSVDQMFDRQSTSKTDYEKLTGSVRLENILADRLGQLNTSKKEAAIVMNSINKILLMIEQELN